MSKNIFSTFASIYNVITLSMIDGLKTQVIISSFGLGVNPPPLIMDVPVTALLESLKLTGWHVESTEKGFTATRRRASVRPAAMSAAA